MLRYTENQLHGLIGGPKEKKRNYPGAKNCSKSMGEMWDSGV